MKSLQRFKFKCRGGSEKHSEKKEKNCEIIFLFITVYRGTCIPTL